MSWSCLPTLSHVESTSLCHWIWWSDQILCIWWWWWWWSSCNGTQNLCFHNWLVMSFRAFENQPILHDLTMKQYYIATMNVSSILSPCPTYFSLLNHSFNFLTGLQHVVSSMNLTVLLFFLWFVLQDLENMQGCDEENLQNILHPISCMRFWSQNICARDCVGWIRYEHEIEFPTISTS